MSEHQPSCSFSFQMYWYFNEWISGVGNFAGTEMGGICQNGKKIRPLGSDWIRDEFLGVLFYKMR